MCASSETDGACLAKVGLTWNCFETLEKLRRSEKDPLGGLNCLSVLSRSVGADSAIEMGGGGTSQSTTCDHTSSGMDARAGIWRGTSSWDSGVLGVYEI